jgi:hypothetical protein
MIAIIVCDMNSKKCSGKLPACPIERKREAKRKKRKEVEERVWLSNAATLWASRNV